MRNQRAFLDDAGKKLFGHNYSPQGSSSNDYLSLWYTASHEQLVDLGGASLLKKYGSLAKLLGAVYGNEFDFLPWKFASAPRGVLGDLEVVKDAIKKAEQELGITEPLDWYRISMGQLNTIDAAKVVARRASTLAAALKELYPSISWDETVLKKKFSSIRTS